MPSRSTCPQSLAARVDFLKQARIFKEPLFLANVALSIIIFSAMFVAYSYLADMLERIAGVAPAHVGWWTMGFGAIGLIGNWIGGKAVDRSPLKATALFVLLLTAGMAAVTPLASSGLFVCIALAFWGIANTALYPICQERVMNSVSHSQALAGTTNVSAANAGIGIGAICGLTIQITGIASVGYLAAAVAGLALLVIPLVNRRARAK